MAQASELLDALAAIVDDERLRGADRLGERVATRVGHEWGGQRLYIPKDRVRRDRDIYELFTGNNYNELARRFRLAENTVRRIGTQERERRRPKPLMLLSLAAQKGNAA